MHSLVRRFIRTVIAFLLLGLAVGAHMVIGRELRDRFSVPHVISAHTHVILVGFVMMMIMGVALWLFPRPAKDDQRYRLELAEGAYWLITGGTAIRTIAELMRARRARSGCGG